MRILIIEPFFTGSHKKWAKGYQKFSKHKVELLTLPGHHWKWRMAGGAVTLAEQFLNSKFQPDLILATDMLDLATFLSLSRKKSSGIPTAIYFHENQITYPWSPTDSDIPLKRDHHYGFINYTSALAADAIFFNSNFHQNSFLDALPYFLKMFPDHKGLENVEKITAKSEVLKLGMDLKSLIFDKEQSPKKAPVILWNHRHEYDKNPEDFFHALHHLDAEDIDYQLVILGESFKKAPSIFKEAKEKLKHKTLHWGYADDFKTYKSLLNQADILPVTSRQDFFGGSVVEAIYSGCIPLLPNRLAFPEHIPYKYQSQFLYENTADFYKKLKSLILNFKELKTSVPLQNFVQHYDWSTFASLYDKRFSQLINAPQNQSPPS